MKTLYFSALIFLVNQAQAGLYVKKGTYIETDLVIGFGRTREVAVTDALANIPPGFRMSKNAQSPALQCSNDEIWNERRECGQGKVRYVLPVTNL